MAAPFARRIRIFWVRQKRLVLALAVVPIFLVLAVVGSTWSTEFESSGGTTSSDQALSISVPVSINFVPFLIFGIGALGILLVLLVRKRGLPGIGVVMAILIGVAFLGLVGGGLGRDDNAPVVEPSLSEGDGLSVISAGNPQWILIVALAVTAAIGAVVVLVKSTGEEPSEDVDLSVEFVQLADELEVASGSSRENIVAMYSSVEQLLAREGHRRIDSETTAEFSERVLVQLGARAESCSELAELYQIVAFNFREAEESDQRRAASLLHEIGVDVADEASVASSHDV